MKTIAACVCALFAAGAPAVNAQQSLPDSNPECMQVNGPECVLKSATVPYRVSAPPSAINNTPVAPPVVVVAPVGTEGPGTAPVNGGHGTGFPGEVAPAPRR